MKWMLLISAVFVASFSFGQKRDKSFDAYWPAFRKAVLALDLAGLDSLTQYPVTSRGTMDSDPKKPIDRAHIIAALKKYFPVDGGVGDGTHKQQIESRTSIPDKDYEYSSPGNMRVGDMQFKKVKGKWKFYFIYMDE
ncbi:MAG: hypothetical protein V4722_24190 [Bacteroidota bacterium]